jgi:superfamily II DNA or RNA helicase
MYIKCDNTPDELVDVIDRSTKKAIKYHAFDYFKKMVNLVDPICYLPRYTGEPFTQDFLFDYVQPSGDRLLYGSIGLWQDIYKLCNEKCIPYDGLEPNWFKRNLKHTYEEFKDIVNSWGLKFPPREYQYEAAYKILQWKKSLSQLATRAGKTLISYIIFRYAMEHLGVKKILMIVPSIDLVKQAYNDFNEYAEFFKTECVWAGGKLVESSNLTVGTFQSLIKFIDRKDKKFNPAFFNGYDCVFVDEVHRATASQMKNIISQAFMKDVIISFGMTGTLPPEKTIPHYCLRSLLGAKIQTITPRELMDEGYISDINITQVRLNYKNLGKQRSLFIRCAEYALSTFVMQPDEKNPKKKKKIQLKDPEFLIQNVKELPEGIATVKRQIYGRTFDDEGNEVTHEQNVSMYIDFLMRQVAQSEVTNSLVVEKMMVHFMNERIDYLCDEILTNCKYNTLVLAHHTEYIKYIVEEVKRRMPDKIICCITGATKSKERDKIKQTLKENNNCVLIASYGCVGTGITLSNLCYGVLFESFKSDVINMQSLGRGLGLSKLKDKYIVYDFIDCFDRSCSTKSLYRQGLEKIKIYEKNKYENNIRGVSI